MEYTLTALCFYTCNYGIGRHVRPIDGAGSRLVHRRLDSWTSCQPVWAACSLAAQCRYCFALDQSFTRRAATLTPQPTANPLLALTRVSPWCQVYFVKSMHAAVSPSLANTCARKHHVQHATTNRQDARVPAGAQDQYCHPERQSVSMAPALPSRKAHASSWPPAREPSASTRPCRCLASRPTT